MSETTPEMDSETGQTVKSKKVITAVVVVAVLGLGGFVAHKFLGTSSSEDDIALEEGQEGGDEPLLEEKPKAVKVETKADKIKARFGRFGVYAESYIQAYLSVQKKWENLKKVERDNEKLRLENARLKFIVESNQYTLKIEEGKAHNRTVASKIKEEAGSNTGRTPEQIVYQAPTGMTPAQLNTLAVSYFKAREDEKAAVLLSSLADSTEKTPFKGVKSLVMTGIAWYRLDNFKKAQEYFDRAMKETEAEDLLPYFAQARLWEGLISEKQGNHEGAQEWFKQVLDRHPQSPEAAWINRTQPSQRNAKTKFKRNVASKASNHGVETKNE